MMVEWRYYGSTRGYAGLPEVTWEDRGMDQGEVEVAQHDSGWEAEVLGGFLDRVWGEVPVEGCEVGEAPVESPGENGLPAGSR